MTSPRRVQGNVGNSTPSGPRGEVHPSAPDPTSKCTGISAKWRRNSNLDRPARTRFSIPVRRPTNKRPSREYHLHLRERLLAARDRDDDVEGSVGSTLGGAKGAGITWDVAREVTVRGPESGRRRPSSTYWSRRQADGGPPAGRITGKRSTRCICHRGQVAATIAGCPNPSRTRKISPRSSKCLAGRQQTPPRLSQRGVAAARASAPFVSSTGSTVSAWPGGPEPPRQRRASRRSSWSTRARPQPQPHRTRRS